MAQENELKLKQVIANSFSIPVDSINDDTAVDTVEEWDSLKHLSLVITLEQEFGVSFTVDQTIEILNYPLIKIVLAEHGIEFSG